MYCVENRPLSYIIAITSYYPYLKIQRTYQIDATDYGCFILFRIILIKDIRKL